MRYRIRFLGRGLGATRERKADAPSAAHAITLVSAYQWPPGANTLQLSTAGLTALVETLATIETPDPLRYSQLLTPP
jgi:hypothetical protein